MTHPVDTSRARVRAWATPRTLSRLLTGAVLVLTLAVSTARAQTISLMAPSIANASGMLTARFGVAVEEMPVLKGELEDGAQLALRCEVRLYEVSDYWFDSHLSTVVFESALAYEPLAKEFVLTLPGRSSPLRNKDLVALLREGWGTVEAPLGPWDMLERGRKYSLRLDTSMSEADAPQGISRFIYFWSWDTGANNSFQLDFTY
jgi:hypothetical protein